MNKFYALLFLCFGIQCITFGQNDILKLKNNDIIVGDLKNMDRGIVTIEPPYSVVDFKIKWEEILEVTTFQRYLITLTNGSRINGSFKSEAPGKIFIDNEEGEDLTVNQDDIVNINSVDRGFLSRLSANIDFGFSLTKANNQRQLNSNLRIDYLADRWSTNLYYNTLVTNQDDVDRIRRIDGGLGYRYFLPKDWNLGVDLTFLSNTEQSLNLRTSAKLGLGKFVKRSNALYWLIAVGAAYTSETHSSILNSNNDLSSQIPDRNSMEGYLGTSLNLYDIGDINLIANLNLYPTIIADDSVESGRFRTDFRFDAKYDDFVLKDFYIRAGFTLNYDNRPVEAGKEVDYIFTTGFGWSW